MLPAYNDIITRIAERPIWFTATGVPRYNPFAPEMLGVYDQIAGLFLVQCQSCSAKLKIGDGTPRFSIHKVLAGDTEEITVESFGQTWTCGDPPRHDCPGAGETMSAIELSVLEMWERISMDWKRRKDLELAFTDTTEV